MCGIVAKFGGTTHTRHLWFFSGYELCGILAKFGVRGGVDVEG